MTPEQNKQIHALLHSLSLMQDKRKLVHDVTGGRTGSSADLTREEATLLITQLRREEYQRNAKMKGKIVHLLCLMGYTKDGQPDALRIDDFIRNIGSRNPRRVTISNMYTNELQAVCTQVEARYKNQLKGRS